MRVWVLFGVIAWLSVRISLVRWDRATLRNTANSYGNDLTNHLPAR
jgi:hypothetical protein